MPPELAGYRTGAVLGEGGFAQVWAAERRTDGAAAAIKVSRAATEHARARAASEAAALAQVSAPHVPALYQQGVLADGRPYLLMERVSDTTLAALLEERTGLLDISWIRVIGDAVLASLQAVHACGLVHLDLKPENIFVGLSPPPRARLVDLGSVQASAASGTEGTVQGSAEYMAPEQIAGARTMDARADIYAFGVILYELLTLRVPFTGDRISVEKGHGSLRPPRPSELASVPACLEELCLDCLAKEARKRPPDVATVRQRLAECCRDVSDGARRSRSANTRAVRLLGGGRQPVVVLWAELPELGPESSECVRRHKGIVCGQSGQRLICGFGGQSGDKPAQAALLAARELAGEQGARVALHVAELVVRPSADGRRTRFYGSAVQQPGSWLPKDAWAGVVCTAEMAQSLREAQTVPSAEVPGFFAPAEGNPEVSREARLVGRDAVLAQVQASMRACFGERAPGLLTLVGEHGLGKSRLASAMVELVRAGYPQAATRVLQVGRSGPDETGEGWWAALAASASDAPPAALVRTLGDELRQAAGAGPVAVIVDDAHLVDDALLDALEYATLDGPGIALWVVVIGHPRLERRRPQWGQRAERHELVRLEPLDESAATALAAEMLWPVEYLPKEILTRLARWTAGNPQDLHDLVRTLKRQGLVRRHAGGGGWYVATAELERLPASPVGQWLATRLVSGLPAELAACVRVCAVLGQELSRDELAWVQKSADEAGGASTSVDADLGILALEARGILARAQGEGAWRFIKASFQDAVYKLVEPRDREDIHRSALGYWRAHAAGSERGLAAIARHAGACGEDQIAADALLELGELAYQRQRHMDADLHFTAVLGYIDDSDHRRCARALGGSGAVRYRMQRIAEALADLRCAQEHARALDESAMLAALMLEEATALDWATAYAESARKVEAAAPLIERAGDARLQARYLVALGRTHYRSEHAGEAIATLTRAAALAAATGEHEAQIIAQLLLGTALGYKSRFEAAASCFAEVIALCERIGDRFHLCVAYNNRVVMWLLQGAQRELFADLRRSIQLAREAGVSIVEHGATHNLAEFLYFSGRWREALAAARRAYELRRFLPEPVAAAPLLLARVLAACDALDEARVHMAEAHHLAHAGEPASSDDALLRMLELVLAGRSAASASWDELVAGSRTRSAGQILLEILYFRARAAMRAGEHAVAAAVLIEAREVVAEFPVWEGPLRALIETLSLQIGSF